MSGVEHIAGETFHGRKGAVRNSFRYGVDYLLFEPEAIDAPHLIRHNRPGIVSVHDIDHGGPKGKGRGPAWVRDVVDDCGVAGVTRILLLAQPRILGHVFNPVSFWLCLDPEDGLRAAIAEVTNTMGDRHSYLCRRNDGAAITPQDVIEAQKIFHVSPFQPVAGTYRFRFDINPAHIGIWIDHSNGEGGVYTNLTGRRRPLTAQGLLGACLRRPFGSRRVLALIHWQALKLFFKGARFRRRPPPPADEVSR